MDRCWVGIRGIRRRRDGVDVKGMRELSGVIKIFYMLIMIVITWMDTFVKSYQTVHLKWVGFIECKLYLNKVY